MVELEGNGEDKTPQPVFFRTMMDKEVLDALTEYAKSMSTALGKWDYNVAIRDLLQRIAVFEKLNELDIRVGALESKPTAKDEDNKEPEIKLLGPGGIQNDKI